MKFFSAKKNILLVLFIAAVLISAQFSTGLINQASAVATSTLTNQANPPLSPNVQEESGWSLFSLGGITGSVIGFIVWVMGTILGYVSGIFFTIAGSLVETALRVNTGILNSPIVATGWAITLNFANLGFVFAIILIAFATIFRVQSYQMQQTLWKLIAAALLVNFSLVIAGAFISISDVFSNFFMDRIGGATTPSAWSEAFAGMFNAQALLRVGQSFATSQNSFGGAMDSFGAPMLQGISSILFAGLFTALAAITIFATAIMLLIRFVYLGVLLILSPLVWLMWIFPGTSGHWKAWWNKFLSWTFFAPIMLFFISLSIYSITFYSSELQSYSNNPVLDAAVGGSLTFGLPQIGEMAIVIGLVIGGLMAAQSMGIAFSGIAMGWATGTSKAFGGWVGRKGIRLGTLPARSAMGQKAIAGMQKFGAENGFFARNTFGRLGNVLSKVGVQQGEGLISQAEARHKNLSDKQVAMKLATMSPDEKVAAFARLAKNKNLDMVPDMKKYIGDPRMKKVFESYGKGKEYGDMEKTLGFNTAMLTGKEINAEGKEVDISLEEATNKFTKSYSIKDYDKLQGNILGRYKKDGAFGLSEEEHARISDARTKSIFDKHPGAISKVRSSLKGDDVVDFQKKVDDHIDAFEQKIGMPSEMREKGDSKAKLNYIKNVHNKTASDNDKVNESWAQGLYGSRKNFGGSLFGSYSAPAGEEENKTT